MTDENMFCFQCEQTAGCTACTGAAGVCGKTADVARLQDELTGALVALARAENGGKGDSESDGLMLEGMFACVSNVSFDPEAIAALERRVRAKAIALGEFDLYDMGELWDAQEDLRSLKSLLLFGMRGVAAYAYHAQALGKSDPAVTAFLYEGMRAVGSDLGMDELLPLVLKCGEVNLAAMVLWRTRTFPPTASPSLRRLSSRSRRALSSWSLATTCTISSSFWSRPKAAA